MWGLRSLRPFKRLAAPDGIDQPGFQYGGVETQGLGPGRSTLIHRQHGLRSDLTDLHHHLTRLGVRGDGVAPDQPGLRDLSGQTEPFATIFDDKQIGREAGQCIDAKVGLSPASLGARKGLGKASEAAQQDRHLLRVCAKAGRINDHLANAGQCEQTRPGKLGWLGNDWKVGCQGIHGGNLHDGVTTGARQGTKGSGGAF